MKPLTSGQKPFTSGQKPLTSGQKSLTGEAPPLWTDGPAMARRPACLPCAMLLSSGQTSLTLRQKLTHLRAEVPHKRSPSSVDRWTSTDENNRSPSPRGRSPPPPPPPPLRSPSPVGRRTSTDENNRSPSPHGRSHHHHHSGEAPRPPPPPLPPLPLRRSTLPMWTDGPALTRTKDLLYRSQYYLMQFWFSKQGVPNNVPCVSIRLPMTTPLIIPSLDNHDNPGSTMVIRGLMVEYSLNSLHIYVQYISCNLCCFTHRS